MTIGAQYGEDAILEKYFQGQHYGFVVDIGAANGLDNSNTHALLQQGGWQGLLVEPEPSQYKALEERYADNMHVRTVNCACGSECGTQKFHIGGEGHKQGSTLLSEWKDRLEKDFDATYEAEIDVHVLTLVELFDAYKVPEIDFLSIDCEGMDYQVLQSIDWNRWQPTLICMEGGGFALPENYREFCRTAGNTLYVKLDI